MDASYRVFERYRAFGPGFSEPGIGQPSCRLRVIVSMATCYARVHITRDLAKKVHASHRTLAMPTLM